MNNPYRTPIDSGSAEPVKKRVRVGWVFSVVCIVGLLFALLLPLSRNSRPAAQRMQCSNNLKQIALALHNYEAEYHSFPPAYTVDAEGRLLHSWRTLILPFLDEEPLYDSIDLSRPWDDPANADAYETSPAVFHCPSSRASPSFTTYLAIVASNGCFHPPDGRRLSEITDSHSETLMVIELALEEAVHWMAPRDADAQSVLSFDQETRFAHSQGTNAVFTDGRVRFLSAEMSGADRRAMISIAGNDTIAE